MSVKLLTEHHLEFLSLKGGCTGSSESTLVKMPHCWKSQRRLNYISVSHRLLRRSGADSGRVLDLRSRGHWFKPDWRLCVVSVSKTFYPLLSTG